MDAIDGKRVYGVNPGNPDGFPENAKWCVSEVVTMKGRWPVFHQCTRHRGHGPEGAYCWQHAKDFQANGGNCGN